MDRRQYYVALAVLAVSGLGGGMLGSWLLTGQVALAQGAEVKQQVVVKDDVAAHMFSLVDEQGRLRGRLATLDTGPGLVLYSTTGEPLVVLTAAEQGPAGLCLSNPLDESAVLLGMLREGLGHGLGLFDASGACKLAAHLSEQGDPAVALYSPANKPGAILTVAEGMPYIVFFDDVPRVIWDAP